MAKKYYVVWAGRDTGVYDSWEECQLQTDGFPGARFKSFSSLESAIAAYRDENRADDMAVISAIASRPAMTVNYSAIPGINMNAICVDAACSGNPGPMEYRGVDLSTGRELFHYGPLEGGTNNIGEFLAIVHALALLERQGRTGVTIYSDSRTAQAWVRDRHARTQIKPAAVNARVRELLQRAETWLQTHTPRNPVVKWPTEEWGEIPADFGRK